MIEKKTYKGFTLFELLLTLAIFTVLAMTVIVVSRNSLTKSRDTKRKSDIKNVADSLELFYGDYGIYPASDANGNILACSYSSVTSSGAVCTWGSSEMSDDQGTIYFNRLPSDPDPGQAYTYVPAADQSSFIIYADLELDGDPDSEKQGCSGGTCSGHDVYVKSSNAIVP